jgi:hypothetical protein
MASASVAPDVAISGAPQHNARTAMPAYGASAALGS